MLQALTDIVDFNFQKAYNTRVAISDAVQRETSLNDADVTRLIAHQLHALGVDMLTSVDNSVGRLNEAYDNRPTPELVACQHILKKAWQDYRVTLSKRGESYFAREKISEPNFGGLYFERIRWHLLFELNFDQFGLHSSDREFDILFRTYTHLRLFDVPSTKQMQAVIAQRKLTPPASFKDKPVSFTGDELLAAKGIIVKHLVEAERVLHTQRTHIAEEQAILFARTAPIATILRKWTGTKVITDISADNMDLEDTNEDVSRMVVRFMDRLYAGLNEMDARHIIDMDQYLNTCTRQLYDAIEVTKQEVIEFWNSSGYKAAAEQTIKIQATQRFIERLNNIKTEATEFLV